MKIPLYRSPDGDPPVGDTLTSPEKGGGESAGIQLSRKEYDEMKEALQAGKAAAEHAAKLEAKWKHAERLMKKPGADDTVEEYQKSVRFLMKETGYSDQEIEQYFAGKDESQGDPPVSKKKQSQAEGPFEDEDEEDNEEYNRNLEDKEAREFLLQMKKNQDKEQLLRIQRDMKREVDTLLDSNKEFGILQKALVELNGDPDNLEATEKYKGELRSLLRTEIDREMKDRLSRRLQINRNRWDDGWVPEESVKAAEAVHGKFKKLVGDPAKLGRSPEVGATQDRFRDSKPVPPPERKKGEKFGDVQPRIQNWIADDLSRAVAGGDTKSVV